MGEVVCDESGQRSETKTRLGRNSRAENQFPADGGYCTEAVRPVGAAGEVTEALPY